jgi:hypothetical protein
VQVDRAVELDAVCEHRDGRQHLSKQLAHDGRVWLLRANLPKNVIQPHPLTSDRRISKAESMQQVGAH